MRTIDTKRLILGLAVIALITVPVLQGSYFQYLFSLMFIGAIMALGENFFFGYCGQINFGAAGFCAIGAYCSLLFQKNFGIPFPIAAIIALVMTAIIALIVSYPLLRLAGHTLALGTLAVGLLIYYCLISFSKITGGDDGIYTSAWTIFGHKPGMIFYYFLSLACLAISFAICHSLVNSRVGRAVKAIRDSEVAASAMGVNTRRYKTLALSINGVLCGLGGVIYAQLMGWITPDNFGLSKSILIVVMVIVGGLGSNAGAVLGGMFMALLPHYLAGLSEYHGIVNGAIILAVLFFYPLGLKGLGLDIYTWGMRMGQRLKATSRKGEQV